MYAYSLEECTDFLEKVAKSKQQELEELNDQLAACRQELQKYPFKKYIYKYIKYIKKK